jgi:hypothetical protein
MHTIDTAAKSLSGFAVFRREFRDLLAGLFPMLFPGVVINVRLGLGGAR